MFQILVVVFLAGCIGGFINGRKADKWGFRYKNPKCDTWFAGILGYILAGGTAAVLFWGLYSPFADMAVLGSGMATTVPLKLTLGDLAGSVMIGLGGQSWLDALSGKKCVERQLNNR